MPIIPIEPAKAVKNVLAFLVIKLFKLRLIAVRNDIDVFLPIVELADSSSPSYLLESSIISPSFSLTILVE